MEVIVRTADVMQEYGQVGRIDCLDIGQMLLLSNESSHMFLVYDAGQGGPDRWVDHIATFRYGNLSDDEFRELWVLAVRRLAAEALRR